MFANDHIVVKPLEKKHLELLRIFRNDPETHLYLTSVLPINEHMQEQWFKQISLDGSKMYFAIEDHDDTFLGLVRCDEWDKINRSLRIGVDIVKPKRKKGYATHAYKLLLSHFFNNMGIHRIWLLVADFNIPAINLYHKLGFSLEGKQRDALFRNGRYSDYLMMSLLDSEYQE